MKNELDHLTAAEMNSENVKKKMKDFYKQTDLNDNSSESTISDTVEEKKFKMMIFSDEKKNEEEDSNDDFIVNDD